MKIAFASGVLALVAVLWFVYGAIGRWLGADSVANLAVNFLLFVAVGAGVGVVWTRLFAAKETNNDATTGKSL